MTALERARDAEALRGDLHHLINPIIGTLRMAEAKGDWDHFQTWVSHYIDRLYLALALVDEAVVGEVVPDERRAKHGVGLNHYPSLVNPDSSPCVSPHEEKSS